MYLSEFATGLLLLLFGFLFLFHFIIFMSFLLNGRCSICWSEKKQVVMDVKGQ